MLSPTQIALEVATGVLALISWSLTRLMHRFPEDGACEHRMQVVEFDYVADSRAMQTAIAENYVGLPL